MALLVSGCGGGPQTAPTPAATPPTSAAATSDVSAPTSSASPAAPSTSTTPKPPTPTGTARTSAQLRKALLSLKDVPPGFERDTSSASEDDGKLTSKRKECAPLVRLMNADKLPGSVADASVSYSGGQEGPFLDESWTRSGRPPRQPPS